MFASSSGLPNDRVRANHRHQAHTDYHRHATIPYHEALFHPKPPPPLRIYSCSCCSLKGISRTCLLDLLVEVISPATEQAMPLRLHPPPLFLLLPSSFRAYLLPAPPVCDGGIRASATLSGTSMILNLDPSFPVIFFLKERDFHDCKRSGCGPESLTHITGGQDTSAVSIFFADREEFRDPPTKGLQRVSQASNS